MKNNFFYINIREKYPPSVSLCMIMQNEKAVLPRCLRLALPIVNEIIIIDTGSTDSSPDIARAMGASVYYVPWDDDFSKPRNISISLAKSDWILILDPDEYILPKDYSLFRRLLTHYEIPAYILTTRNYTNNPAMQKFILNDRAYIETAHYLGYCPSVKTRLFQRRFGFTFTGCFHELLDHSIHKLGLVPTRPNLPVHHHCDSRQNRTTAERSILYQRLGRKKVIQDPQNGQAWNEYAVALSIAGKNDEAIRAYQYAILLGYSDQYVYHALAFLSLKKALPIHFQFFRDKALCCLYSQLTHYRPDLKPPLPKSFIIQ